MYWQILTSSLCTYFLPVKFLYVPIGWHEWLPLTQAVQFVLTSRWYDTFSRVSTAELPQYALPLWHQLNKLKTISLDYHCFQAIWAGRDQDFSTTEEMYIQGASGNSINENTCMNNEPNSYTVYQSFDVQPENHHQIPLYLYSHLIIQNIYSIECAKNTLKTTAIFVLMHFQADILNSLTVSCSEVLKNCVSCFCSFEIHMILTMTENSSLFHWCLPNKPMFLL